MKRFLALVALGWVLMAGTAGMASADTLYFTSPPPYSDSPLILGQNMQWSGDGGGQLYCSVSVGENIISFTTPTNVNNFQMNAMPYETAALDPYSGYTFGSMDIKAFDAANGQVWSTTVNLADYTDWASWLPVDVSTDAVSKIIFYGPDNYGFTFFPSIDNLVINEAAAAPIPAAVWLLGSGLLGLVGLRRKFTR